MAWGSCPATEITWQYIPREEHACLHFNVSFYVVQNKYLRQGSAWGFQKVLKLEEVNS